MVGLAFKCRRKRTQDKQDKTMDISRQQFAIRVSRLRQDRKDEEAVNFWLHHGTGISWAEFQQIDPLCDFGEFAERKRRSKERSQMR